VLGLVYVDSHRNGLTTLNEVHPGPYSQGSAPSETGARPTLNDWESVEPILDPELPIVDPHHHLWWMPDSLIESIRKPAGFVPVVRRIARYLFDDFLADVRSGHNIRATVYAECNSMYRADGPEHLRSIGEIEFANGAAAMAASGRFGPTQICAGIIGHVDLFRGTSAEPVLEAAIAAGGGRLRAIRNMTHYDPDPEVFGDWAVHGPHALRDAEFRKGFSLLRRHDLSFDTYVLEPQLPDVIELAQSFPDTQIVLNHLGAPVGFASYAGRREERFSTWRQRMQTLAGCANVSVKLGALGMFVPGFTSFAASPPATPQRLAAEWRPYIETCIELFGVQRCMFESNFPNDAGTCTYRTLWNTFKLIARDASAAEKMALFSGTATRIYRLNILR
jgi:L-fuconolactonase